MSDKFISLEVVILKIIDKNISKDGKSIKFLQMTSDNIITETAYVDDNDRFIICYASQLGCLVACSMCYNGIHSNFERNLTQQEIVLQCSNIVEYLNLTNEYKPILFSCMGIGEALLNYENVIQAILELSKKYPKSKFALATTGIKTDLIPKIAEDLKNIDHFKLTISLHGSNDILRKQLIPIHTSVSDLKMAVRKYQEITVHKCEWNYVLLSGVNDSEKNAIELVNFLNQNDNVKLSVFNEIESCPFKASKNSEMFKQLLQENGISCKAFEPAGKDIGAACGQMATHYLKK